VVYIILLISFSCPLFEPPYWKNQDPSAALRALLQALDPTTRSDIITYEYLSSEECLGADYHWPEEIRFLLLVKKKKKKKKKKKQKKKKKKKEEKEEKKRRKNFL
jgi:hypothetical protein